MLNNRLDPLSGNTPIVDKAGVPTLAFQRKWAQQITANTTIPDLSQRKVTAGSGLKGGGDLGADITLSADVQAVLDQLGTGRGSLIYLGDSAWHLLAPGTASQVLTTGGPGADPAWADAAPTTPALTHNHIFVGSASNVAGDVAMSGDATIADTGAITVTKTGGAAFDSLYLRLDTTNNPLTGVLHSVGITDLGVEKFGDQTPVTAIGNVTQQFGIGYAPTNYPAGSTIGVAIASTAPPSGTTGSTFVLEQIRATANGSNPMSTFQALKFDAIYASSGAATAIRGIQGTARNNGGASVTQLEGCNTQILSTSGSATQSFNFFASSPSMSGGATITTAYGFYCNGMAATGITNPIAFYAANSTDTNRFAGPTKVGDTAAPVASAVFELTSTTKGFLSPRMTTTQRTAISSPADGLEVYDTTIHAKFINYNGVWTQLANPAAANPTAQVGPAAVNGAATTFMRSDAAPKLADTAVTPATYGSASTSAQVTVDQQGRVTAASSVAITTGATGDALAARWTAVPASPGFDVNYDPLGQFVFSNSNKTATPVSSSPYNYAYGAPARYTGKRYFEVVPGSTSFCNVGVCGSYGHVLDLKVSVGNLGQFYPGQLGWAPGGSVFAHATQAGTDVTVSTIATWAATNVLCVAIDIDNMLIWFRNGSGNWNNNASANPATGTLGIKCQNILHGADSTLVWPAVNMGNTSATVLHLLAADFAQSVPSGFTGWAN